MQTETLILGGPGDHHFEAGMHTLFPGSSHWDFSFFKRDATGPTNHIGFSDINFPAAYSQYLFAPSMGQSGSSSLDQKPIRMSTEPDLSGEVENRGYQTDHTPSASYHGGLSYPLNTSFTPANAGNEEIQDPYNVPPLQAHFDRDACKYDSSDSFSMNGSIHSASHSKFDQLSCRKHWDDAAHTHRRWSVANHVSSTPYPTGRRRKSEHVEPGSARAVYLEKNRKAASKCRSKQKKQQEDLVELARDVERKNKALKSEVELLKSDLRDLMTVVGKHNDCPDGRLRRYIQLEADRLVARNAQGHSPIADLLSSRGSSDGSVSPDAM